MIGLLIKDFNLLKNQKQFFILMLVVCVILVSAMGEPSFIISYMTVIFSIFSVSSISYDTYDNGMSFLFTLPISRKTYVAEKYVFGALISLAALIVSCVLAICGYALKGIPFDHAELLFLLTAAFLIAVVMQSLSLPIQLKFGPEKSRVAIMLSYGAAFALLYGLVQLLEALHIDVNALLTDLSQQSPAVLVLCTIVLVAAFMLISFGISLRIMKKKQF